MHLCGVTFPPHTFLSDVGCSGAGVIAKGSRGEAVQGVTTACAVWVSAAIGVTAASGMSHSRGDVPQRWSRTDERRFTKESSGRRSSKLKNHSKTSPAPTAASPSLGRPKRRSVH